VPGPDGELTADDLVLFVSWYNSGCENTAIHVACVPPFTGAAEEGGEGGGGEGEGGGEGLRAAPQQSAGNSGGAASPGTVSDAELVVLIARANSEVAQATTDAARNAWVTALAHLLIVQGERAQDR
jgi:hypothetical protein